MKKHAPTPGAADRPLCGAIVNDPMVVEDDSVDCARCLKMLDAMAIHHMDDGTGAAVCGSTTKYVSLSATGNCPRCIYMDSRGLTTGDITSDDETKRVVARVGHDRELAEAQETYEYNLVRASVSLERIAVAGESIAASLLRVLAFVEDA